jgi:hypothetical protein
MRYQKRMLLILLFVVTVISFPVTGVCQGDFDLTPKISTTWQKDDNFYKAETMEREVTTSIIKPGFELGYNTAKSSIALDYTLNSYNYSDEDTLLAGMSPAQDEDYIGHTGVLDIRTTPTARITWGLSDSYHYTRDPANSDVYSDSISRNKYFINRLTPSLFYNAGEKFSAEFRYRHTKTDYSSERETDSNSVSDDSTENRGIFDLGYNFNSTTSFDLEYQYWDRAYVNSSDYKSGQIKLIVKKQYKYFSLEAGGGYHERNFDDPSLANISLFTYHVGLSGQNPPVGRGVIRSYINLVAESNLNDAGPGDYYFKASRYSLNAGHLFMERLPFDVTAVFQNSDYERAGGLVAMRDDDTFKLEGSLGYIVSSYSTYLTVKLVSGYVDRSSNITGRSYTNSYLAAKVDFKYGLGRR